MEELTSEGDVTLYDRKTKQSRTIHWGPGHSIEWWWQEGNGSCDCNRHLYFWDWDPPPGEEKSDREVEDSCICRGHERYIITHIDGDEVPFKDWNFSYKAEFKGETNG